ncbi:MAG: hypothetical protein Q8L05_05760 [Actinomycetota bacterium]|nr:hypothetical protein [Actinomycetota bacterium]MDP2289407.1 hypothetical protein [Actinomycetota bacterium]
MSERPDVVVSMFSRVDQAVMRIRLEESPLEDAEVGFLSDRDATGQPEVSDSLLAGIRIFAGVDDTHDKDQTALEAQGADADSPQEFVADEGTRENFILFGPAGKTASSA